MDKYGLRQPSSTCLKSSCNSLNLRGESAIGPDFPGFRFKRLPNKKGYVRLFSATHFQKPRKPPSCSKACSWGSELYRKFDLHMVSGCTFSFLSGQLSRSRDEICGLFVVTQALTIQGQVATMEVPHISARELGLVSSAGNSRAYGSHRALDPPPLSTRRISRRKPK